MIDDQIKGMLLAILLVGVASLSFIKSQLNKIGFVEYSLGFKFDHSVKSVRMSASNGNMIFTLNNDNSLKFNLDGKNPKSKENMKFNMTIFPPGKPKK